MTAKRLCLLLLRGALIGGVSGAIAFSLPRPDANAQTTRRASSGIVTCQAQGAPTVALGVHPNHKAEICLPPGEEFVAVHGENAREIRQLITRNHTTKRLTVWFHPEHEQGRPLVMEPQFYIQEH